MEIPDSEKYKSFQILSRLSDCNTHIDDETLDLLDFDSFIEWSQKVLDLSAPLEPDAGFFTDLNLDALQIFNLAIQFDRLVGRSSIVTSDIFANIDSVRELYLYYLKISSMPKG